MKHQGPGRYGKEEEEADDRTQLDKEARTRNKGLLTGSKQGEEEEMGRGMETDLAEMAGSEEELKGEVAAVLDSVFCMSGDMNYKHVENPWTKILVEVSVPNKRGFGGGVSDFGRLVPPLHSSSLWRPHFVELQALHKEVLEAQETKRAVAAK